MEGVSAVPAAAVHPLPAAAPHAPPSTPVPAPAPVSTPTAALAPPSAAPNPNPTAFPPACQAPGPGPGPGLQQSGPGLPANTSTTAETTLSPGLLALLPSNPTNDSSVASRPNGTSTTPQHPQPSTDAPGLGYQNHYAAIPPRPEPLLAAPHVQAQPPLRTQPEPEPAMVTSDIVEASTPTPPAAPQSTAHQAPQPATAASAGGDSNRGSSAAAFQTTEQKRHALRMALKRRWASGDMDHVPKKRMETIRRKKAEEEQRQLQATARDRASSYNGPGQTSNLSSNDHSSDFAAPDPRRVASGVVPASSTNSGPPAVPQHTADVPMVDFADDPEDEDWQVSDSDRPSSPLSSLGNNTPDPADFLNMDLGEGTPPSLEMATATRPYNIYIDDTGRPARTWGALIPDGYQLSDAFPGLPYICPIRTCQKVLGDMRRLGCHFVNLHRVALLHDNEDGTLSFRGLYRPRLKGEKLPAIIVSRGPPDPSEPGPVPPSMVPGDALARAIPQTGMPVATNLVRATPQTAMPVAANLVRATPQTAMPVAANLVSATPQTGMSPQTGMPVAVNTRPIVARAIPQTGMPVAANLPAEYSKKPSEAPLRGNWQTLWNYVRPFMVDHTAKRPPLEGWVSHLINLPRVRDIEWNTPWIYTHPFRDRKPRDISAVIIQVTGEPAPEPCTKCTKGKGPFKGCVMISSGAQYPPLQRVFACGNCFYHYGQSKCSHKDWGRKRAKKLLRQRKAQGTLNTVGFPSPESGQNDAMVDDSDNLDDDMEDVDDDTGVDGDDGGDGDDGVDGVDGGAVHDERAGGQSNKVSGTPPPGFPIIQDAEPGRPYGMWPDPSTGELRHNSGALLPAGYKLDTTTAKRPWICPVRTCRQLFIKKADLGYHFQRAHFASLLNDNGDGTLSIKGVYSSRNISSVGKLLTKSYPYVVSKQTDLPASTDASLAQPSLPPSYRMKNDVDMSSLATPVRDQESPADLWAYLQPLLSETKSPPDGGFVRQLLTLPRVRRVELLPARLPDGTFANHIRTFHEKSPRDVAAMIIQATGDIPPEPCQRCLSGKGLMKGCVVISTQSFSDARRRYYSCANCLYHGNQTYCSLKSWVVDRPQPKFIRPHIGEMGRVYDLRAGGQAATPSEGSSSVSADVYTRESASEMARPAAADGPWGAVASPYDAASEIKEVRNAQKALPPVPPPVPPPRQWTTRSANAAQASARQPVQVSSSSLISAGVIQPSEILEMETWEMAPGRIRESAGQDAENIAFSKAFLSTNQVVPVCEDVSFRVDTIHSGATLTLDPDANKSRLCSIATGKVKVKTGDEPEFTIGPHGMFRVKPGMSCTVQNWMYVDAILHVTVLTGFI